MSTQGVTMSGVSAVLITLAIIVPCLLVRFLSPTAAKISVIVAVVSTSLWVAIDSSRLRIRSYKSQVAAHPFVLFTASLGLWIVVFPVYLVVRSKVHAGLLPEQAASRQRGAMYLSVALWCLLLVFGLAAYFIVHTLGSVK